MIYNNYEVDIFLDKGNMSWVSIWIKKNYK